MANANAYKTTVKGTYRSIIWSSPSVAVLDAQASIQRIAGCCGSMQIAATFHPVGATKTRVVFHQHTRINNIIYRRLSTYTSLARYADTSIGPILLTNTADLERMKLICMPLHLPSVLIA
ncbi:hypothetical protein AC579_7942 [Pseudocercospora musae]|uniref:Uncharacterized protein n=1 Tax=Pseudocercospora musae TaxID=113226 RepID=A0A139IKC8_9PEZI|nr:hypothetical protein AC579_7942 [Pseudocercospora musae]